MESPGMSSVKGRHLTRVSSRVSRLCSCWMSYPCLLPCPARHSNRRSQQDAVNLLECRAL